MSKTTTAISEQRDEPSRASVADSSLITHHSSLRTYRPHLPATWWLRNRRYLLYMLREFTVVPITLWLLALLFQIARLGAGPSGPQGGGYYAYTSPRYVLFSVVCLAFALLHSVTWLNLSGVILRVTLGQKDVPPRTVTAANYAQWALATVIVGALLIWLGS
jgi:fumarate reductase subunit C